MRTHKAAIKTRNTVEYLDLRDLASELAALRDDTKYGLNEADAERLDALEDLESQFFSTGLAEYARNESTLIPKEEFEDYAQELASDLGFAAQIDHNPLYPYIDWAGWAEELEQEYTEVTFDGQVYLIHAY